MHNARSRHVPGARKRELMRPWNAVACIHVRSQFRNLAQNSAQKLSELNETKGLRDKVDLGDPNKWGHADFKQSGRLLGEYEKDLVELKAIYQELKGVLREIQSNLLKGDNLLVLLPPFKTHSASS